jgi:integrase
MAYSGMLVTEAGQLRVMDIEVDGDGGFIHLRQKAGHVKNKTDRIVPIHQALIAEGFLEFVRSVKGERLFPQACLNRKGERFNAKGEPQDQGAHGLANWVGTLGLPKDDPTLSPNHAWRHRFRVEAVKASMQREAVNRIVGHAEGDMGETYEQDPFREVLTREMGKFLALRL